MVGIWELKAPDSRRGSACILCLGIRVKLSAYVHSVISSLRDDILVSSPGYGKFSVFKSRGAEGQPGSWRSARLKVAFNRLLIYRVDYCPRECYFSPQI